MIKKKLFSLIMAAACTLTVSSDAVAADNTKHKRKMVLPGHVAKNNIQQVNSKVRWHTNLNSALADAHRQKKMLLWIHLVGKIDGAT